MKKKVTFIKASLMGILVIIMALGMVTNIYAAIPCSNNVQPRWTSISMIELEMSFDETSGNATGSARKQSTATSIEGTLVVYKQVGNSWVYVGEGYASKKVGTVNVSVDFVATANTTYKAVFTVTAYTGTSPETEIVEDIKTC